MSSDQYRRGAARPTAAATPARSDRRSRAPRRGQRRARRVHRVVHRIDVWSLAKVAGVYSLCGYIVAIVSGIVLWQGAKQLGTIEGIEGFMEDQGGYDSYVLDGGVVLVSAVFIGLVLAVLATVLISLGGVLFNLISDLTGGVRLTMIDEDLLVTPAGARRSAPSAAFAATEPPFEDTAFDDTAFDGLDSQDAGFDDPGFDDAGYDDAGSDDNGSVESGFDEIGFDEYGGTEDTTADAAGFATTPFVGTALDRGDTGEGDGDAADGDATGGDSGDVASPDGDPALSAPVTGATPNVSSFARTDTVADRDTAAPAASPTASDPEPATTSSHYPTTTSWSDPVSARSDAAVDPGADSSPTTDPVSEPSDDQTRSGPTVAEVGARDRSDWDPWVSTTASIPRPWRTGAPAPDTPSGSREASPDAAADAGTSRGRADDSSTPDPVTDSLFRVDIGDGPSSSVTSGADDSTDDDDDDEPTPRPRSTFDWQ